MPVTHVYIGDSLVDLFDKTVIATNISRVDVANLSKRSITYTNSFDVPDTKNNRELFGFPSSINSNSALPYSYKIGKLVQDGICTIHDAVIYINSSNSGVFKLSIFENSYDFYAAIKGKTLRDLEPISDSALTGAAMDSARNTTSGIVAAIVDWNNPSGAIYQSNFYLPSFYYHTFVSAVLSETGLIPEGSILTDDDFLDLIIPYFNDSFEYKEDYYSLLNSLNVLGGDVPATNQVNVEAVVVGKNFSSASHGTFQAFFSVGGITWNTGTQLVGRIKKNGVTVASGVIANSPAPGGLLTIQYEDFFDVGDIVNIVVYSDAMSTPGIDYTRVSNSYLRYTADGLINPSLVVWNETFRNLRAEDLLKDFYNRFGLIDLVVDNRLILKSLDEIINDRANALDWTSKDVTTNEISFRTDFAQENLFSYKDNCEDERLGTGSISINNDVLKPEVDIFKSVFGNSLTVTKQDLLLAKIPVFDSTSVDIYDFINPPDFRLLTIKDRDIEGSITFNATPRTDYKIGYFLDNTAAKDTGFQYFIDNYYSGLSLALQKTKTITKLLMLTSKDISDYNPHKIIFINDSYYLLNKIKQFIPGRVTVVELFKL